MTVVCFFLPFAVVCVVRNLIPPRTCEGMSVVRMLLSMRSPPVNGRSVTGMDLVALSSLEISYKPSYSDPPKSVRFNAKQTKSGHATFSEVTRNGILEYPIH